MRGWFVVLGVAVVAGILAAAAVLLYRPGPRAESILAAYEEGRRYGGLTVEYPLDRTVFPPELPAPTFRWRDEDRACDTWLVTITFSPKDQEDRVSSLTEAAEWTPSDEVWETIKRRSREQPAKVTILGVDEAAPAEIRSAASISISTSKDEVGAPIFYREVNLPFVEAVKDPSRIRWRFGPISSKERPPVVLEKLPVCGNCHSFSRDGATMGMDVDYANNKASYIVEPVAADMVLDKKKIITWSDYKREDQEPTFGLLSQVSPDGKYVVSTVKDRSVFVPRPDMAFSQLFFPIKGILVVYARQTKVYRALPGADDPRFVQSNPNWSPDGKYLVFARSKMHALRILGDKKSALLSPKECREFLEGGKTFLYDLYRIPFNEGRGGNAEPLAGASNNGMSNYFARYSPDGKWIVFCKAKTFMLLQPDSELWIIPAAGGDARRLECNTARMNSWHSWSPNGRWLVFSSKANTAYTQLFLTHIDAQGQSTPAVLLARFTSPDRAANIPEFVNLKPDAIHQIREDFLDDYSFTRSGDAFAKQNDVEAAIQAYRQAIALDPNSAGAHAGLGACLMEKKLLDEAKAHLEKAIALVPADLKSHNNLGALLVRQGKLPEAIVEYRAALGINPSVGKVHLNLGNTLWRVGQQDQARAEYAEAVRLDPDDTAARYQLACAAVDLGQPQEAVGHFQALLAREPDSVPALSGLASLRATSKYYALRNGEEAVGLAEKACRLARYRNPVALGVLAAAFAEAGRFPDAVRTAEQAAQMARDAGNQRVATELGEDLELYKQGRPLRE
jgi:tetratricopeptide (TPR) repeat protein/roadblock/LC7 domain-containing protein